VRDAAEIAALEASISRERLKKYLDATGDHLPSALDLYERNMRLSEAFYTPLQGLEVCLRNKLDAQLEAIYGPLWLTDHTAAPLDDHMRSFVNDAIAGLPANPTRGQIVAELRFAFWVGLLGKKYDNSLWRAGCFKVFTAPGGRPRKTVHGRMNAIRRFRNRVAHHEPIFHKDLAAVHCEILEAVAWMCPATCGWIGSHSRVTEEMAK